MSRPQTGAGSLADLRRRLQRGTCAAARRTRPGDWQAQDDAAVADLRPESYFAALDRIRDRSAQDASSVTAVISELARRLREHRALLIAVLFSPDKILDRLLIACRERDFPLADSWVSLLWVAAAAWEVIDGELPPERGFAALDADLLRPLAARLLFLVTSEPMRYHRQGETAWWGGPQLSFGGSGILVRALGGDSWNLLVAECQKARREWLRCLGAYESHPYLAQARPAEFEQDLRATVFGHRRLGRPLGLSVRPLGEAASLTAEDKTVLDEVTDRHFLPRFDLLSTVSLACFDDRRAGLVGRAAAGVLAFAAGAALVVSAGLLKIHLAAVLAAVCLAVLGIGIAVFGRAWSAPWLLRYPAAAAVGVIALISLSPGSWVTAPPGGWLAAAALGMAAFGYLLVEAHNHGVAGVALVSRSLAVALIGAVYGLMVALIGLVAVAPAFAQNGGKITALWDHPSYSRSGLALWLAASWCLAVGVFSQILWDDRPITAPLAHLSWRRQG